MTKSKKPVICNHGEFRVVSTIHAAERRVLRNFDDTQIVRSIVAIPQWKYQLMSGRIAIVEVSDKSGTISLVVRVGKKYLTIVTMVRGHCQLHENYVRMCA